MWDSYDRESYTSLNLIAIILKIKFNYSLKDAFIIDRYSIKG